MVVVAVEVEHHSGAGQYGPFLRNVTLLKFMVQLLQLGLQLGIRLGHGVVGSGVANRHTGGRDGWTVLSKQTMQWRSAAFHRQRQCANARRPQLNGRACSDWRASRAAGAARR